MFLDRFTIKQTTESLEERRASGESEMVFVTRFCTSKAVCYPITNLSPRWQLNGRWVLTIIECNSNGSIVGDS
jgi:hypothetical protein